MNPFELDYDDDGYNWNDDGDDEWQEQYAGEDQRLMDEYNNSGSSSHATSSGYYHSNRQQPQQQRQQHFDDPVGKKAFSSYHNHHDFYSSSGSGNNDLFHQSQLWKFGVLAIVLVMALVLWNSSDRSHGADDYVSMIDEIPNDEYRLIILGERHSGTAWLQARLSECFPHASVLSSLQRPGFLFQEELDDGPQQHDAIVIHLTLNPYDWLEQMRLSPEHAPNHVGIHKEGHMVPLPWKEFLDKPWTMDRPERDVALHNVTDPRCQLGFRYDRVVSCAEKPPGGPDNPIYELNPENGTPYDSILHLRAAKLRNHQSVQGWKSVKKFVTLSYEHAGKEFKSLVLKEIEEFADWEPVCSGDILPPSREQTASMSTEYVEYVTENADWNAEGLVSYKPWTVSDIHEKGIQEESNGAVKKTTSQPTEAPTFSDISKKEDSEKTDESGGGSEKTEPSSSNSSSTAKSNEKDPESSSPKTKSHSSEETKKDQSDKDTAKDAEEVYSNDKDGSGKKARETKEPVKQDLQNSTKVTQSSNVTSNATGNGRTL